MERAEELYLKEKSLLEEMATIDYLTKTLNCREFIRRLDIEMERMKMEHSNLLLL